MYSADDMFLFGLNKSVFEEACVKHEQKGWVKYGEKIYVQFPRFWKIMYTAKFAPSKDLIKTWLDEAVKHEDYKSAEYYKSKLNALK
jgi:hypothetical protein